MFQAKASVAASSAGHVPVLRQVLAVKLLQTNSPIGGL